MINASMSLTEMRVKCPNCGSTAQIKLVWEDRDSYSTTKTKEYIAVADVTLK